MGSSPTAPAREGDIELKLVFTAVVSSMIAAAACAQPLPPPGGPGSNGSVAVLYTYGNNTGVGNGADSTEDTLLTFNIPAGTLKGVGDRLKIFASGTCPATTDNKVARVRLNNTGALQGVACVAVGNTSWFIYMEVQKNAAGASQQQSSYSMAAAGSMATTNAALTLVDTSPIALTVTGQNSTAATANSVVVKYVSVEYLP
jgi:hypothetical protein